MKRSIKTFLKFGTSQLIGAFVFGFDTVILCLSYATLLYQDALANYYTLGLTFLLFGAIITVVVTSLFSSLPTAIAQPQDEPFPIYLVMVSAIIASLTAQHQLNAIFPTVICAIAIATVSTGLIFLLFGSLKIGSLFTFIPYPVVGGFLAGVGWLLLNGAFSMLTGLSLTFPHFFALFEPITLVKWSIALVYATVMLLLLRRNVNIFLVMCLIISAIAIFYLAAFLFNISLSTLQTHEFLINAKASENLLQQLKSISLEAINWQLIGAQAGKIITIIIFSVICILIKATSIEVTLQERISFNHELKVAGLGNIFSGLLGGIVGYLAINNTTLNTQFQKNIPAASRLAGVLSILVAIVSLAMGLHFVAYLPRFIPGGIFIFFALSFLREWLVDTFKKLFLRDYIVIVIIFLTIMTFGILPGVVLGVALSMVLFIINYSRISVVKYMLTGKDLHSNKQHEPHIQKWLDSQGENLLYIKLQNYLFFGNVKRLSSELEKRLINNSAIKYVIYDFSAISGLDSSCVLSLIKMGQLAIKQKLYLVFAAMSEETYKFLRINKIFENNDYIKIFPNYDAALEWCEDTKIREHNLQTHYRVSLEEKLSEIPGDNVNLKVLRKYYEVIQLKKGDYLFKVNDPAGPLYYIESGYLSVLLDEGNHKERRVRSVGPGNTVGEVAFYLQQPRSASVVAEENCVLFQFTLKHIRNMNKNPELALKFQQFIVTILAERTAYANQQLSILF